MSDCSSPSRPTSRNHVKEVAVQSRSKSNMEKSLTRTVNREEEPCRSGMEAGLKDSFVVKETPLRNNNHQEEKIYKMKFQDSQQQNGTFLTIETSSCSSADLNECVVVEDENELSPIMEIDNQNEPRTCSDKPVMEQQKFYKEFMRELVKLKQELETERMMRQKLESKISHQSRKIKELKHKALPEEETSKNPPIRLRLETVTKGKYISNLGDSDSSDASSPNYSPDAVVEIKPELCDDSSTEDAAFDTDGLHSHDNTLDSLANMNEIQRPVTEYERMQFSERQNSKEKNLRNRSFPAFDDSISCVKNKAADSSRKRKVDQEKLRTDSENSLGQLKNSSEVGVFISNRLITSRGVNLGILDPGIKLQQQTESTACRKEVEIVDKRTGSILKRSECNSVNEGRNQKDTAVDIARKRQLNEALPFSEITSGSRVKSKTKANVSLMDQSCSDDGNNNHVTDTNIARNHDKQLQISEGKTDKRLRQVMKKNGCSLPLSNLDLVSKKQTVLDSGSHKHDEHEVRTATRRKEDSRDRSSFSLDDEEDDVLSSKDRNKSISPECKTKSPCKSSLDYIYGCNLCGLKFRNRESLQCHVPCVGSVTGKDPLKCGACSKTFSGSVDLEKHLQGLHTNKLFKCEICSKDCASKSCLDWHMQIHVDVEQEMCENQSKAFLSTEAKAGQKSSECRICKKRFLSRLCLQSHMKQHNENERESHSREIVDCQPENLVIPEKSATSRERMNRSFRDALDVRKLFTADLVNEPTELQEQNSRKPCDRERSSWSIFDQSILFCEPESSLPLDLDQKSCEERRSSVSIFHNSTSSEIAAGQNEHTGLICAEEISSENKVKTYRPYCVKCWDTFEDLQALEEHAKFCNESCRESSPRELIPSRINESITTKLEDQPQSSECVMENGSEEEPVNIFEDVTENVSTDAHLKKHVQERKKSYPCMHCTKCFAHRSSLNRHLEIVLQDPTKSHDVNSISPITAGTEAETGGALYCLTCPKMFSTHRKLKKHLELHKLFGSSLSCTRCKQKFSILDSLQEHACQPYSILGPLFKCPECEEGFEVGRKFKKHMSRVHSVDQHFKCKHCGRQYEKFCQWNYHVQAHRTDRRYVCNKCGKKFKFLHHLKVEHLPCISKSAELKCPRCNQEFVKASQLRSHVLLCQNERAVRCEVCSRLFNNKLKLENHMRCHTGGEKPYKCQQCTTCFSSHQGLIRHVHHHSAEKPYACVVCGKTFVAETILQRHLKIHMADRPYKCSECDMSFVFACYLRYHNAKVHKGVKTSIPCRISTSEDQLKSSECVMEKGPEVVAVQSFEDTDENGSINVAKSSSFELLKIGSDMVAINKLHDGVDEETGDGFDEVTNSESHDWAKNSSDGQARSKPDDLASMLHALAKNAADDLANSESDDLAESLSEELANIESYLANGESDFLVTNGSEEVAKVESDDLAENGSDDLAKIVSEKSVENGSSGVTNSVLDKVTKNRSNKLFRSHEFLKTGLTDSTKSTSHEVTKNSSHMVNLIKSGPQKSSKSVLCEVSNCGSLGVAESESNKVNESGLLVETKSGSYDGAEGGSSQVTVSVSAKLGACSCDISVETENQQENSVVNSMVETKNSTSDCIRLLDTLKQQVNSTSLSCSSKGNLNLSSMKKCGLRGKIIGKSNQVQKTEKEKQTPKRFYGCGLCGCLYFAMVGLKRHLPCEEEEGTGEKDPLFCGECNEKFREETKLKKHVVSVHSEDLFSCSICNKIFAKKLQLKLHMRSHTGERPFKCRQCGKFFKDRHHRNIHLPCYVDPGSEIQCNKCQMTFDKITQLRTHLLIDHSNAAVQCDVCGKKFPGRHSLDAHLKRHTQEIKKPYSCTHCTKHFAHSSSLKRHLETVLLDPAKCGDVTKNFHSKSLYDAYIKSHMSSAAGGELYCLTCLKTFSTHWKFSKHMELHKQFGNSLNCSHCKQKFSILESLQEHTCQPYSILGPQSKCPECNEGFEVGRQLKKHMSEVHSVDRHFNCKQCGKQFEKFCHWNSHVQAHRTDRRFVCNKCGKKFKYLHHLRSGHLPCISEAAELKCPTCNQEFVRASQLRSHITLCQNERAVRCEVCSKLFNTQSRLDKHMRTHTGEKPYHCSQCTKSFGFREALVSHFHRHSVEKPYVCDVCSKAFAAEQFLRHHLKIHTTDKPFKCSECDMSFVYACYLRYHNAKVHKGVKKRYVCSICNKTFCTKMYLNVHMCLHTGQTPYLCSFCGKGFPAKILLKYHMRVHTGEKPYACQYCYRRFSMPRSMRNHERVHTGEKPYECTICGMKFPQSSYLKNHSRKVHMVE